MKSRAVAKQLKPYMGLSQKEEAWAKGKLQRNKCRMEP